MNSLINFKITVLSILVVVGLSIVACNDAEIPESSSPTSNQQKDQYLNNQIAIPEFVPPEKPLKAPSEVPEELKAIWETWAFLTRDFVDKSKLDPGTSTESAIRGILASLGDRHTVYIPPEAFTLQNQDLAGQFEGIGAHVSMRADGKLVIVAPIPGGPAESAGIRSGDIILEVDEQSIDGLTLLEAVSKIRGPRGTQVKLLVKHIMAIDPEEILVTRDVIPIVSVILRSELGNKIAHIRLTDFNADTAHEMAKTIDLTVAAGTEALIIDVRNNPGGLLESAVDVISEFLDGGLILYQVDGSGNRKNITAHEGGTATQIPLVILANEFSASASEILVGALQDHKRAVVVGNTTFGKGSVGIFRMLSNGGGLSITISRFFTPSGRIIEGEGLEPDFLVTSRDRKQADIDQLKKAIGILE